MKRPAGSSGNVTFVYVVLYVDMEGDHSKEVIGVAQTEDVARAMRESNLHENFSEEDWDECREWYEILMFPLVTAVA